MQKIALVTDTASDINKGMAEQKNIHMLHYQIIYGEKIYKDQEDITSKEVLNDLDIKIPTTSFPALDEMHALFSKLEKDGYTHILVITLSSGLSGCYNALNLVKEEYPNIETYVYDTKTISVAQGVMVLEAAKLIEEGYTIEEIIPKLDIMRKKQHTFFIVDTLKYLEIGGRIGHVSAALGKLLNLKPIITVGDDGKYSTLKKVRGRAKAIASFVESVQEITREVKHYKICFIHGAGEEIKNQICEKITQFTEITNIEDWGWISPVACVHCGPGFVGMLIQEE